MVWKPTKVRQKKRSGQGKRAKNQSNIKAAGAQVMGINRQQRDDDSDSGDGGKYRKKKRGKYFFIADVHSCYNISWCKVVPFIIGGTSTQGIPGS